MKIKPYNPEQKKNGSKKESKEHFENILKQMKMETNIPKLGYCKSSTKREIYGNKKKSQINDQSL